MKNRLIAIGSQNYIHFECATWMIRKKDNMHDNKEIPKFDSYEEMAAFWETHSLADYWVRQSLLISILRQKHGGNIW